MPNTMKTQAENQLLSVPNEVLQAIYAHLVPDGVHVFLRQGKIVLSKCVMPVVTDDLTGFERSTTGNKSADTIWARRLKSSWGPHWQCEEVAQGRIEHYRHQDICDDSGSETTMALLFVCKKLYAFQCS